MLAKCVFLKDDLTLMIKTMQAETQNLESNSPGLIDEAQMYDALSSVCSSLGEQAAMSLSLSMSAGDS